jgi:hypothetical protein
VIHRALPFLTTYARFDLRRHYMRSPSAEIPRVMCGSRWLRLPHVDLDLQRHHRSHSARNSTHIFSLADRAVCLWRIVLFVVGGSCCFGRRRYCDVGGSCCGCAQNFFAGVPDESFMRTLSVDVVTQIISVTREHGGCRCRAGQLPRWTSAVSHGGLVRKRLGGTPYSRAKSRVK